MGKVFPIDVQNVDILKCRKDVLLFGQDLFLKLADERIADDEKVLPIKYYRVVGVILAHHTTAPNDKYIPFPITTFAEN
jgi:hypothetical protein